MPREENFELDDKRKPLCGGVMWLEWTVRVSNTNIGEKIILHKRNNKYNGSQAGTRLTCLRTAKASIARERVFIS